MHDAERSLYLENPKRPYSWTGELDSPPSPNLPRNGSLKVSKIHGVSSNVKELRTKHERASSIKDSTRASGSNKRGQFHFPRSGSQLLAEKLPSYLADDGNSLSKKEHLSTYTHETPSPITYSAKSEANNNGRSTGGRPIEKKRSRFVNLRRKSPPTAMTSHVSDFEYFSLSDPPPGLARPVQIFPACPKPKPTNKRKRKELEPDRNSENGEKCRDCMTRVPYATLIATVMCCVGVGVFCGTMYRGTTLTLLMFDEVFRIKITWDREYRVEPVQLTFMIIGAAMGGLGLMILFLGCLSTGATRAKVYRTWRGRVGGRVSCAIFMGITYLLSIIWLLMFIMLIIVTVFYTLAWFQCQVIPENQCIDYNQFEFLFPKSTTEEDRRVCREEKKTFCKDCVQNAEVMFILATVAAFLVIMSLVHYLMCLSANYAHIKDQEKFMDLQEIQYLQESEMSTLPKDRF